MVQLIELFGDRNLVKILNFFLRNPTIQIYQKDLRKKTKLAKVTSIKWLKVLTKYELLNLKSFGAAKVYSLNRGNYIVKRIKVLDTILLLTELKDTSKKYNIEIYLYGSCARGEDAEESDVDLLIIGKIKREEIIKDIIKLSDKTKRKIKFQIFSSLQWSEMAKKDKAFYERVEKDKIGI